MNTHTSVQHAVPLLLTMKENLAPILGLALLGFAIAAHGAIVPAEFSSVTTVPVTAASYDASGNEVALSLAFAPPTGTTLTVVKNTGLAFIDGTFSNLAQGQAVSLTYNNVTYQFVANYYGGSGNDLVLHWAGLALAAWGYNDFGTLGDGSTTQSNVPAVVTQAGVLKGKTVVAVAAGGGHSLALCSDGTLAAWGRNDYGQLGDGSTTQSTVPVAVTETGALAGKTVVAVTAGYFHSLALCSDGTLAAWGGNGYGQLGNGSFSDSNVPVAVTQTGVLNGKTVVAVSAGHYHGLALCSDGTLAAWGYNDQGQLGNGSTNWSNVPVAVTQTGVLYGKTIVAVMAGSLHSLTLVAVSQVSTLSGLALSAGSLSPAFASGTSDYSSSVVFGETPSVTVTPTATEHPATILVNGSPVASGTASPSIPLAEGANTITVVITAPNGTTQSTYTITVNRVPDAYDADGDGLGAYLEEVTYGTDPAVADIVTEKSHDSPT